MVHATVYKLGSIWIEQRFPDTKKSGPAINRSALFILNLF